MKQRLSHIAAGIATVVALAGPAHAQDDEKPFEGFYAGATIGGAFQGSDEGSSILFDRNLDGTFGDTVTTTAGANAFSPGFCGGAALTGMASGGCSGDEDGVDFSGRVGYDKQVGMFVIGALAEFGQADIRDSVAGFTTTPASYTMTRSINHNGRLAVRGGFAAGKNLFYATGGLSIARIKNRFDTTNVVNRFTNNGNSTATGFNLGGGYERKITDNISLGVEYLYTDLGDDEFRVRSGPGSSTPATNPFILGNPMGTDFARSDDRFRYHAARATIAYRF
jgi:outer membrane immunogenic protein